MRALAIGLVAVVLWGCERLAPDSVGMGVARLTVRNAAAITSVLAEDKTCGFGSAQVLAGAKVSGATGQLGSVTWTVDSCLLDLGPLHAVSKDCRGVETRLGGKVTVKATKTVEGILTGNPNNPVVPVKPDAARVTHEAQLEGFTVERSDSNASLELRSGTLSWEALPRLAQSASKGLCAVATNELGLGALSYSGAKVFVNSGDRHFEVDVPSSNLEAQLGKWGEKENFLGGKLQVWDSAVTVPVAGDQGGLDPAYDAAAFTDAYACKADLALPVNRECPAFTDRLAQGVSSLTVAAFGTIASVVDEDTRCGFNSPAVLQGAQASGPVGTIGTVTVRISSPCSLSWGQPTAVKTYCDGLERRLEGTVRATGTKSVKGWITGDPAAPVIPTSRDAASVTLTLDFSNLTYSDSSGDKGLTAVTGSLTGELGSRLGLDTSTGACSIKSPAVYFRSLAWTGAQLKVHSGADVYPVAVSSSRLDAQSGAREDHTNWLEGELSLEGKSYRIPVSGPAVLDPTFDQAKFDASWACTPNLKVPQSDEECSFRQTLGQNAARLIVQSAGAVGSMINKDSDCGFDDTWNKLNPTDVTGDPPNQGSMTWEVSGCRLVPGAATVLDTYCSGAKRVAAGEVTVSARRVVTGERETKYLVVPSIIPDTPEAVTLDLTQVQLKEFAAYSIAPQAAAPAAKLVVHSGTLSSKLVPILGERKSAPGTFDVPTPVASFTSISLKTARTTLTAGAKTFHLDLDAAALTAQAGGYKGKVNTVAGSLKVNGVTVTVPSIPLDPSFQQAAFDQSYACTDDLKATVAPN